MTELEHLDDWVVDYLEGTLDQVRAKTFRRHLKRCSPCRAKLESYEKARTLYQELPDDDLSESSAENILRESRAALPTVGVWQRRGVFAVAAVLLLAAAALVVRGTQTPSESCQALREAGARLADDGKPQEALSRYNDAANCDPTSSKVAGDHHQRGLLLVELGEREDALEHFHTILNRYPDYERRPEVMLQVASALERDGRFDDALSAYREYLEENPMGRDEVQQRIEAMELTDELLEQLSSLGYIQ